MALYRRVNIFCRNLFRRESIEQDLDDELRSFVDLLADDKARTGTPPEDARRSALLQVEGVEQVKEATRDARTGALVEAVLRDLRYGLRVLLKKPGFFVIISSTLGLGIGAATTLFSVVESQLWRRLPFKEPDRLVAVWEQNEKRTWRRTPVSAANFVDLQQRARTFDSLAAMQWSSQRNFSAQHVAERPRVAAVSSGFFETLGIQAAVGRTFDRANDRSTRQQ